MHWGELNVWKKAHELVLVVYRSTARFPGEERYGIVSQLRRAVTSVPANIVEGNSRNTTREFIHFLYNARGSLEETRYFLYLSKELGYLEDSEYKYIENACEDTSKMLNGLINSLKQKIS